ncbi:MAG: PaaI family thioesterase [Clostridiales bacterium]|jgi:acyl-coenzyme A thioesterase PaaI-like protein|nr:PaaI family thioesterase [Clostridiales bacterium]
MVCKVNKVQNVSRNCIVCGIESGLSLKTQFFEVEGGLLVAVPHIKDGHQSFPGRMHGGMITALLDEVIGRAYQIEYPGDWGVTGELTTRYLKPVPLDKPILAVGRITQSTERLFFGDGKIILAESGQVLAACVAKYFRLPIEKIAGDAFTHTDWFADVRPAPESIALPDGLF